MGRAYRVLLVVAPLMLITFYYIGGFLCCQYDDAPPAISYTQMEQNRTKIANLQQLDLIVFANDRVDMVRNRLREGDNPTFDLERWSTRTLEEIIRQPLQVVRTSDPDWAHYMCVYHIQTERKDKPYDRCPGKSATQTASADLGNPATNGRLGGDINGDGE